MEKRQNTIKYRLLACIVAAALAIGLSAMPALAEPSDEANGSISIVSVDTSSEKAADKTEAAADRKEPAKSEAASTKSEKPAQKPVSTDSLNPAEKLGAVLEGEGQAAVSNATGISAQATEEEEGELSEKERAKKAITTAVRQGAQATATYYGDLSITKEFVSGPLYTVLDENGNAMKAEYTVMFRVVGHSLTDDTVVVYPERTIGIKVNVGGEVKSNSVTLDHLPEGNYTVAEITYPGCGYECVGKDSDTQTIKWTTGAAMNPNDSTELKDPIKFEFKNKGTGTTYPNQGFVNHYTTQNTDQGKKFGWTTETRD